MQTAHGGRQGDKGQALGEAQHPVLVPAEALGTGQDSGPVAPRLAGAPAPGQAMGRPTPSFAGPPCNAARTDPREAHRQPWAPAQREASMPETHVRQRDPRFAPQARPTPPTAEQVTVADFPSDNTPEAYRGPPGQLRKVAARRHQIAPTISRS
jgi:hypothetical protein